jgi:hypothetical protein
MFVAVAAVACLAAIRSDRLKKEKTRVDAAERMRASGALVMTDEHYSWAGNASQTELRGAKSRGHPHNPGRGETVTAGRHVYFIAFDRPLTDEEWQAVELFPEATIYGVPDDRQRRK